MTASTTRPRRWRATALRVSLVVGLLAVVVAGVPLERLAALGGPVVLAALALQVPWALGYLLRGYRHALVLSDPPARLMPCVKAVLLAGGLNALLPARLGELVTATYVRQRLAIPLNVGLAAVAVERLADLLILGLFAVAALSAGLAAVSDLAIALVATGVALAAIAALALLDLPRLLERLLGLFPSERLRGFLVGLVSVMGDRLRGRKAVRLFLVTLLCWAVSLAAMHLFVWIVWAAPPSLGQSLLVMLGALIGSAIPGLPAGLGTFEAGVAGALMILGSAFEEAVLVAIVLHIATLAQPVFATLLLSYTEDFGLGQMIRDLRARKDAA